MAIIRRLFGLSDDLVAGGSEYDDLTLGEVDDADYYWPVTGGTFDRNIERFDRNDEVRGRRAGTAPLPFRASPVVTVPLNAYVSIMAKALKKTLGGPDTITGAMAPYTHEFEALAFGATALPCANVQLVRDDLNHKMSGGAFNRLSASFPLDGEATMEFEIWGLYHTLDPDPSPTASFTGISEDPLMLRDAEVFIDGSMTRIPDLEGFDFSFVNNLNRKFYAKRNIVEKTIGTPTQVRRLWFPSENKLGGMQDVTYSIQFGNVNVAQEVAMDFAQIQKFVFECEGSELASGGKEILRITIHNGVFSGGGAEGLTARDDITARFDGGAFYSETALSDVTIEITNDHATAYV